MSRPTIILDPGHGGNAPAGKSTPYGTPHASGQHEKVINLELARRVMGALNRHDVRLTRNDDRNLSLGARAGMARSFGGDTRFVSLHSNWGYPRSAGSQTWIHTRASGGSHRLASSIQGEIARLRGGGPIGVQSGELAVLDPMALGHGAAACLVEAQLPTDRIGTPMVPQANQLDAIARAIAQGIQSAEYGGAPRINPTSSYGGDDVVIGADGWREALNSAISAGAPFNIVIGGDRLVSFLNDVVAEAGRRGINLLDAGVEDIRRLLAFAEEAGSQVVAVLREWLASVLPWPLSSVLEVPSGYQEGMAVWLVPAVVIVLILAVAYVLVVLGGRAFDWITDRDTLEGMRICKEAGGTPSLNRSRSRTEGLQIDQGRGISNGGDGQLVISCTPPPR